MLQLRDQIKHKNKKIEDILKSFFLFHPKNIDLSLERINRLLKKLNDPQKKIKNIIHIAGTNGKGSIATILYNLQKSEGKTVNIYRSPHLLSFNERIHIKNKEISNHYLLNILQYIKFVNNDEPITFFEIITVAAFFMFHENKADVTILEVGLGGRFDATNVIEKSLVSIISTIGIDHKEFLGSTIKLIASEKVGIIKKKSVVISSKQTINARKIIQNKSLEMSNKLFEYNKHWKIKNKIFYHNDTQVNLEKISLIGAHQYINFSCALIACIKVKKLNIDLKSLDKILPKIYWRGRLEKVDSTLYPKFKNFEIWIDVAHNKLGFSVLVDWIKKTKIDSFYMILALGIKKDYLSIIKEIKKVNPEILYIVSGKSFRSHDPKSIKRATDKIKIKSVIFEGIFDALNSIKKLDNNYKKKKIIITGSIGLVGNFLEKIE